jgi:hypothetical protein
MDWFVGPQGQTFGPVPEWARRANRNPMRRANPSEPIVVKVFLVNEIGGQGAKRTQAAYRSCYQILGTISGPFSKKNVWLGRKVRSTIPERKSGSYCVASDSRAFVACDSDRTGAKNHGSLGSREKMNGLTQRRQGAKTRKQEPLFALRPWQLCAFASDAFGFPASVHDPNP